MEDAFNSWKMKAAGVLGAFGALVLLGWLTEESAEDKLRRQQQEQQRQQRQQQQPQQQQPRARRRTAGPQHADEDDERQQAAMAAHMLERTLQQAHELRRRGEYELAEAQYGRAVEALQADGEIGPGHEYVGMVLYAVADMFHDAKNYPKALSYVRRAVANFEAQAPRGSSTSRLGGGGGGPVEQLPEALKLEAELLVKLGELEAADEPLSRRLRLLEQRRAEFEMLQLQLLPSSPAQQRQLVGQMWRINQEVAALLSEFADLRKKLNRLDEADAMQLKVCELLLEGPGLLLPDTINALLSLAAIRRSRRRAAAEQEQEQQYDTDGTPTAPAERGEPEKEAQEEEEEDDDALVFEQLLDEQRARFGPRHVRVVQLLVFNARRLLQAARYAQSVPLYEEAREALHERLHLLPSAKTQRRTEPAEEEGRQEQQQQQQREEEEEQQQPQDTLQLADEMGLQRLLTDLVAAYDAVDRTADAAAALEALRDSVRRVFAVRVVSLPHAESRLLRTVSAKVMYSLPSRPAELAPHLAVELALNKKSKDKKNLARRSSASSAELLDAAAAPPAAAVVVVEADDDDGRHPPQRLSEDDGDGEFLLRPGSVLEAAFFELDGSSALVQDTVIKPDDSTITIESPVVASHVRRGHYYVKLTAFADASKAVRLGEHHVLIPSLIDTDGVTDLSTLQIKILLAAQQ